MKLCRATTLAVVLAFVRDNFAFSAQLNVFRFLIFIIIFCGLTLILLIQCCLGSLFLIIVIKWHLVIRGNNSLSEELLVNDTFANIPK